MYRKLKSYFQGIIIILMLTFIIEIIQFGISVLNTEWSSILNEVLLIEIIPFTIIYFYGYKRIPEKFKRTYLINAFAVMLIMYIIFSINIVQKLFFRLAYKNSEYINFILIPFMELFYFIKTNIFQTEYTHAGIIFAVLVIIIQAGKNKIQKEKVNILEPDEEYYIKRNSAIMQGFILGLIPLTVQIIAGKIF